MDSPTMATFTSEHKVKGSLNVHPHLTNGTYHAPHSYEAKDAPVENFRPIKVIVIGAGFSGIYCGVRFPQRIKNLALTIYE